MMPSTSVTQSCRTQFLRALPLALVLFLINFSVNAGLLYNNGAPNQANGWVLTHCIQADDFPLAKSTRVERVTFWSVEIGGVFGGSITWQIYSNDADNIPGSLLISGTSVNLTHQPTGLSVFGGFREFVISFDLGVVLPPGTYWLCLHNGPFSNDATWETDPFYWETTPLAGLNPSCGKVSPYTGGWFGNFLPGYPSEFAFEIFGVPGPDVTVTFNHGAANVRFSTLQAQNYSVEYKTALTDAAWTPLRGAEFVPGTGSDVTVIDPPSGGQAATRRFYRALLL